MLALPDVYRTSTTPLPIYIEPPVCTVLLSLFSLLPDVNLLISNKFILKYLLLTISME